MSKVSSVFALCFCLWIATAVDAQTQPQTSVTPAVSPSSPEVPYLRSILEEVRLSRLLMQQMMGNTLRTRILVEQLAKQQNRVDTVSEEISQLKSLISQAQDNTRGESELQEMEMQIREVSDPQERERRQREYFIYRRTIERERAALQKEAVELLGRQSQLEHNLRVEQGKLTELQGKLDSLDQELERLTTEIKPRK